MVNKLAVRQLCCCLTGVMKLHNKGLRSSETSSTEQNILRVEVDENLSLCCRASL